MSWQLVVYSCQLHVLAISRIHMPIACVLDSSYPCQLCLISWAAYHVSIYIAHVSYIYWSHIIYSIYVSHIHWSHVLHTCSRVLYTLITCLLYSNHVSHTLITFLVYTAHVSYIYWSHVLYTVIMCRTYTDHMSYIHWSHLAYTAHVSYIYWSHVLHMYSNHMFHTLITSHTVLITCYTYIDDISLTLRVYSIIHAHTNHIYISWSHVTHTCTLITLSQISWPHVTNILIMCLD